MSIVLDRNFSGTAGSTFAGDAVFSVVIGTQTIENTDRQTVKALRFPAASQSIVQAAISGTPTVRTLSRIWKITGTISATCELLQVRSSSARGTGVQVTSTGKLRLTGPNSATIATSTASVPTNTEFRVTLTINGTTVSASFFANTTSTTPTETISGTASTSTAMAAERDGLLTSTGLGAGVTFDMSWPQDESTTTDPGPRNYGSLGSSTVVFDHDWVGQSGSTFAGDDSYAMVAGAAPTYVRTARGGKALRFPDEQGIIGHSFSATTSRVYSRVYRLSAPCTVRAEVIQTRIGSARGPAVVFTETNKLLLMRTDGSAVITGATDLPVGSAFRVTLIVAGTSLTALLFTDDTTTVVADSLSGTLTAAVSMTSVRDGIISAGALGPDVTLDVIWPQEDSAADPGPRTYPVYPVGPPIVSAGPDLVDLEPWRTVALTGTDIDDGIPVTSRVWSQVSGPAVTLIGSGAAVVYEAPPSLNGATLRFRYTVTAGGTPTVDEIDHTVLPVNEHAAIGGVWVPIRTMAALPVKTEFGTLQTGQMSQSATYYPQMRPRQVAAVDEWRWSTLQPNGPGTALDATAVNNRRVKWQQFKDQGFTTKKVGLGLHYEPAATFAAYPLGSANQDRIRFEGSDGSFAQVDGGDALDGVWSAVVRDWYDDYLTRMAAVIPFSEIDVIRVTSGSRSELLYPEQPTTRYWAFADHVQNGGQYLAAGQSKAPTAGWDPSTWTTSQRRTWVEWYVQSLVNAAVWQMAKCRSLGFTGVFEIVMPGRGVTVSAYESDIATSLPQSSTLARGVAWAKMAEFLPDDPLIRLWASSVGQAGTTDANRIPTDADYAFPVNATAANSWSAYRWIRFLAQTYGYQVGGENPGLGMGADDPFYSDTTATGLLARAMAEIAPTGARPADAFDWAHADNLRTSAGLMAAYNAAIAAINP